MVNVVHVHSGPLHWRRLYITEQSAWQYAARMQRRGHWTEVQHAVLLTRRADGGAA